jgi:hypothetical protein
MWLSFNKGLGGNTWQPKTDTFSSIESKIQVFLHHVYIQIFLVVDCPEINCVRRSSINQLAKQNSIFHGMEDVITILIDGDNALEVFIIS